MILSKTEIDRLCRRVEKSADPEIRAIFMAATIPQVALAVTVIWRRTCQSPNFTIR